MLIRPKATERRFLHTPEKTNICSTIPRNPRIPSAKNEALLHISGVDRSISSSRVWTFQGSGDYSPANVLEGPEREMMGPYFD